MKQRREEAIAFVKNGGKLTFTYWGNYANHIISREGYAGQTDYA
jgi:hypothetical protein